MYKCLWVSIMSPSMNFRLDFGTVPAMWCFCYCLISSNTTNATSGAGRLPLRPVHLSCSSVFGEVRNAQSLVFCIVLCPPLFVFTQFEMYPFNYVIICEITYFTTM